MSTPRVIRSAGVVGSFTLLSRGLGLLRDIVMAAAFGTSVHMSAFVVAFTIPNLFRRLFGEGALSSAFVPVFVESMHRDGETSAWALARRVVSLTALTLVAITALGLAGISAALAGPLAGDPMVRSILELLRIMLPYMVFICLAALSMAILNARGHFALPAATPCLLNIVWIIAAAGVSPLLAESPAGRIRVVAWAVLLAGALQLGVQIPALRRRGFRIRWDARWSDPRVRRVLLLMGPAALGMAVTQLNVLVDRLLAVWVGAWAPAALFFSERLIYFPLGIFATAMSTVLLPTLSGQVARGADEDMRKTVEVSLRNLLFIMAPAAVGLLVLAEPIIRLLLGWGVFDAGSVRATAVALQFYAPGLLAFSLAKIFVPAFYARQDTKTPVRIGLLTVGVNLVLNIAFVLTWPASLKHAGLAFATVLAEMISGLLLAVMLQRKIGMLDWGPFAVAALRILLLAGVMGGGAVALHAGLVRLLAPLPEKAGQLGAVLGAVALSAALYAGLSTVFRIPEWKGIREGWRRR